MVTVLRFVEVSVANAALVEELGRIAHVPAAQCTFSAQEVDFGKLDEIKGRIVQIVTVDSGICLALVLSIALTVADQRAAANADNLFVGGEHCAWDSLMSGFRM